MTGFRVRGRTPTIPGSKGPRQRSDQTPVSVVVKYRVSSLTEGGGTCTVSTSRGLEMCGTGKRILWVFKEGTDFSSRDIQSLK